MGENSDLGRLIFFLLFIGVSAISFVVKKLNEYINRKRMEIDRRQYQGQRDEAQQRPPQTPRAAPLAQTRPQTPAPPHPGAPPTQTQAPPPQSAAEAVLRQLETMLPPDVARAKREARQSQSSQTQQPAPTPAQRTAPAQQQRPRPVPSSTPGRRPPPPPPQVRGAAPIPVQPYRPPATPVRSPVPVARTRAEPMPHEKLKPRTLASETLRQKRNAALQAAHAGRIAQKGARRSPATAVRKTPTQKQRKGLWNRETLRRAILHREILGPPVANRY